MPRRRSSSRAPGPPEAGPGYLVSDAAAARFRRLCHRQSRLRSPRICGEVGTRYGETEGEVHLTGLMRPPQHRNFFTPADDRRTRAIYFTRDPALIAAHFGLPPAAPFIVDADATPVPGGWPRGGTTERDSAQQSSCLCDDLVRVGSRTARRYSRPSSGNGTGTTGRARPELENVEQSY